MTDTCCTVPGPDLRTGLPALDNFGWRRCVSLLLDFRIVVAVCCMRLVLAAIPHSMADPDIWWHLRNAQMLFSQHALIHRDLYSFTAANAPWIDHEWLSEIPFYLGWRVAGSNGVFFVTAAVIEAIFLGILWLTYRASSSVWTASLVTAGAACLSTVSFGPRTLLFGWLCLVVELILLSYLSRHPRLALLLPLLFAFWVNLHGSWMIGLTVFGLYSVLGLIPLHTGSLCSTRFHPTQARILLIAWIATPGALFCNPYGWRLVAYPFNLAFHQKLNVATIQEWQSLDLHSVRGEVVLVAILLLVVRQLWRPRLWTLAELALLLLGFYSAFNYSRFLFLLAILGAPILARSFPARSFPARSKARREPRPWFNAALLLMLCGLIALQLHKAASSKDQAMQQFPVAALPALSRLPPHARVFNEYLWGGYLEWYRRETPVFIDSRVDIFEYNGTFKDYLDIIHIANTIALLDRYSIDYVFFEKETPLIYLLQRTGGWKVNYQDDRTILLERTRSLGCTGSNS